MTTLTHISGLGICAVLFSLQAALAADPRILRCSGRTFCAGELARIYHFTDVDGRRVPPFNTGPSFNALLRRFYYRHAGRS